MSINYRTSDGQADYLFSFEEQDDYTWRVYIENQPSYANRDTDAHATHRYSDGNRRYICWTTDLDSLEEAEQVAALWADETQKYIRTGYAFGKKNEHMPSLNPLLMPGGLLQGILGGMRR